MKIKNKFCGFVDIAPGEKDCEDRRAWQGAPSIARTKGGRLFVAFMSGGIYEPDPRNCIYLVTSDDDGETWSAPVLRLDSIPGRRLRNYEGEVFTDPGGRLWFLWASVPYEEGLAMPTYDQKMDMENDSEYHSLEDQAKTFVSICEDPDADELRFSEPRELFGAVVRNKPLFLSDRWIFSAYLTGARPYYELFITEDEGKTFRPVRIPGRALTRAYDEPALWRTPRGVVACAVRTRQNLFYRSLSYDSGETWTEMIPMTEGASQRPCALTLRSGEVLFIPSIRPNARNGLQILISADGIHFEKTLVLDDRERVSYPEAVEAPDGTVYVVYDRERNNKVKKSLVTGLSEAAKEILFARIPGDVLRTGEVDERTVRARVISKAGINTLKNEFTE